MSDKNSISPKKIKWSKPVIQILDMNKARGATAGPSGDKFGSLSA